MRKTILILSLSFFNGCFLMPDPPVRTFATFPNDWGRRCPITIESDYVTADITGIPVLFTEDNLPSEMFDADGSYPAQPDGDDIRFTTDQDGATQVPVQVVEFTTDNNPANGTAEIWVKLTVDADADQTIYVWYNEATTAAPTPSSTYGSENVWDNNYKGVYHLEESISSSSEHFKDATSNANHLTLNSTSGITSVSGKIGNCVLFDQTGHYLSDSGLASDVQGESAVTISAWIKSDNTSTDAGIIHGDTPNEQDVGIMWRYDASGASGGNNNTWKVGFGDVDNQANNCKAEGSANIQTTNDQYVVAAWTQNNAPKVYLDGSYDTNSWSQTSNTAIDINSSTVYIGVGSKGSLGSSGWDGQINEVRISVNERSSDWIATEYNSQNSPGTFAIEGTPEDTNGDDSGGNVTRRRRLP